MSPILFSMFLFSLAGAISPGPVNLIAASIGANAGFFRALPHVTGASISYLVIVWLMGSGLQSILLAYPEITGLLKYLGAHICSISQPELQRPNRLLICSARKHDLPG